MSVKKRVVVFRNFQPVGVEIKKSYLKMQSVARFSQICQKCDFVAGFYFYYTVDAVYLSYQSNQEKMKSMQGT